MTNQRNSGRLVAFEDGTNRKGIAFHKDQEKEFKGKASGKVLVTMLDENYRPSKEPKRIVDIRKLKIVGYVD